MPDYRTDATTETPLTNQPDQIVIETFPVGPLQCNCTILGDTTSGEAIIVDPGGDADLIQTHLRAMGLSKVTRIIHTHAHFDHFLASGELREATGAPLAIHKADNYLWEHLADQCNHYNIPFKPTPPPDAWLQDEEELCLCGSHDKNTPSLKGQVLFTPGHTPGSSCFWFEDQQLLLAGDTLFKGSIGRTDLWGGDMKAIEKSIRQRLYKLDDDTEVITGHGPSTSIGREKKNNAYIRA